MLFPIPDVSWEQIIVSFCAISEGKTVQINDDSFKDE